MKADTEDQRPDQDPRVEEWALSSAVPPEWVVAAALDLFFTTDVDDQVSAVEAIRDRLREIHKDSARCRHCGAADHDDTGMQPGPLCRLQHPANDDTAWPLPPDTASDLWVFLDAAVQSGRISLTGDEAQWLYCDQPKPEAGVPAAEELASVFDARAVQLREKAPRRRLISIPLPTLQAVLEDKVPRKHQRSLMRDMAYNLSTLLFPGMGDEAKAHNGCNE